jgi:hypothetical protein
MFTDKYNDAVAMERHVCGVASGDSLAFLKLREYFFEPLYRR